MNHTFTFKDLSILQKKSPLQQRRMVLVDDDPTNFTDNPDHGIPIQPFLADNPGDNSLANVALLLQELENLPDVRPLLRQRFGIAATYQEAQKLHTSCIPKQWEHVMNHVPAVQL
jgi:TFIIF-interacting CTD phosphatase-like protein